MKIRILLPRSFEARKVSYDDQAGELVIEPIFAAKAVFGDIATVLVESDDGTRQVSQRLRVHGSKGILSAETLEPVDSEFDLAKTPQTYPATPTVESK